MHVKKFIPAVRSLPRSLFDFISRPIWILNYFFLVFYYDFKALKVYKLYMLISIKKDVCIVIRK